MFQTSNNYDSKNLLTIYHSAGRIWEAVKIPMMELTSDVVGNLPPTVFTYAAINVTK